MIYRNAFKQWPEFFRSTRIDVDGQRTQNYIITQPFIDVVDRLERGLRGAGSRALSITGPYGTGKSATVLKAAQLISQTPFVVRDELLKVRPDLIDRVDALEAPTPILINCAPDRLAPQILAQLPPPKAGVPYPDPLDLPTVVEAVVSLAKTCGGLLVVLDELGKPLEYAAAHPDAHDVFLLQLLAEAADRSTAIHPLMIVTVLHQSFQQYGHRSIRTQREEFAKIQGRFEDFAFHLPSSDVLAVIGQSIRHLRRPGKSLRPAIHRAGVLADSLVALAPSSFEINPHQFRKLCEHAAPLHPAVTLLLGPLFRQLAQNERSLFGFLGSTEPMGFQNFLDTTELIPETPSLYTLADLFDYLASSMGASLYQGIYAHRWADIETALLRVGDAPQAHRVIKTLGMMSFVQGYHLPATQRMLEALIGEPLDDAIAILQTKSIVVYRRFSDSFRLWNGSDVDIEARLATARQELGMVPIAEGLSALVPPRPIVARRHSTKTGALRWFEVTYLDVDHVTRCATDVPPSKADGRLYVVLLGPDDTIERTWSPLRPWQILCTVPIPLSLREAVQEIHYLDWVERHTPEIATDDTAAREVYERRLNLEQLIESILDEAFFNPTRNLTVWTQGQLQSIPGATLNRFLSDECDRLYHLAPVIESEFVNRHDLSSATSAARNDLLRRMITEPHAENLGIVGFPPQRPIYLSTLLAPGLHSKQDGEWRFVPPNGGPWLSTWEAIHARLQKGYCAIGTLWSELMSPPYGVRRGMLPIVTLAFMLVHRDRISLIEDNAFVADITWPVIERMMKVPEKFTVRLTTVEGARQRLINAMAQRKLAPLDYGSRNLLGIVRPLVIFSQRLPHWTQNTQSLSPMSQAVRHALLSSKEPADLLFNDLPVALQLDPIIPTTNDTVLDRFVERLTGAIQELARAYQVLQQRIETIVRDAFGFDQQLPLATLRLTLHHRAKHVLAVTHDLSVNALALRLTLDGMDDAWLDGVAAVVAGTPPKSWYDRHVEDFGQQMVLKAREFEHYERLVSLPMPTDSATIRLGITTAVGDWETLLTPQANQQKWVESTMETILSKLDAKGNSRQRILLLAAELIRRTIAQDPPRKEKLNDTFK